MMGVCITEFVYKLLIDIRKNNGIHMFVDIFSKMVYTGAVRSRMLCSSVRQYNLSIACLTP